MRLLLSSWQNSYQVCSSGGNGEENPYKLFAYFCPRGEGLQSQHIRHLAGVLC